MLRDAAYERMRDAIVDGTLAPGSALKPDDVARRLGLSRAPIREALARLAADGLVETKPQSWTRVTEVIEKDVRDAAAQIIAGKGATNYAIGLATAILGLGFESAGYVANVAQTPATLEGMRWTVALLPLAFLALSMLLMTLNPLTRNAHAAIVAELARRRESRS